MTTPSKRGTGQQSSGLPRSRQGSPLQVSGEYFKLVPQGSALAVVKVAPEELQCSSGGVLTRQQLEELLWRNSIPAVSPAPSVWS